MSFLRSHKTTGRLLSLLGAFVLSACATTSGPFEPHVGFKHGSLEFKWPVLKGHMTRGFKHKPKHQGLDIAGPLNTPIFASEAGKVIYVGQGFNGYGKLVIIEHDGDKWASFYAHLNNFHVREGQWIKQGDRVGYMGRTGRATGVHLHFEIRHNLQPIDPLRFLSKPRVQLSKR